MRNLFIILSFTLLVIIYSKSLKTAAKCIQYGGDCDFTSYCCGKNECKDYRCSVEGTKDNQVKWAPEGEKCDYFHHCKKFFKCESHRCILYTNKIVNDVKKKLNGDY